MPVPGAKPKEGDKHGHTATVHGWEEVENKPYRGKKPTLPASRKFVGAFGAVHSIKICTATKAWWKTISTMPHCCLWTESDWQFALATAIVADCLFQGDRVAAAELRIREKVLGTTVDSRRDLRIKYVDKLTEPKASAAAKPSGTVTNLDERRARLTNAT